MFSGAFSELPITSEENSAENGALIGLDRERWGIFGPLFNGANTNVPVIGECDRENVFGGPCGELIVISGVMVFEGVGAMKTSSRCISGVAERVDMR